MNEIIDGCAGPGDTALLEIATTITFKSRTAELQAEGCDPAKVAHLYLRDAAARTYVPLDTATYAAIVAGTRPLG